MSGTRGLPRARLCPDLFPSSSDRPVEQSPNIGREIVEAVWLTEKMRAGIEPAVMDDCITRVAGREQHEQIRPDTPRLLSHPAPIQRAREHHVGK